MQHACLCWALTIAWGGLEQPIAGFWSAPDSQARNSTPATIRIRDHRRCTTLCPLVSLLASRLPSACNHNFRDTGSRSRSRNCRSTRSTGPRATRVDLAPRPAGTAVLRRRRSQLEGDKPTACQVEEDLPTVLRPLQETRGRAPIRLETKPTQEGFAEK